MRSGTASETGSGVHPYNTGAKAKARTKTKSKAGKGSPVCVGRASFREDRSFTLAGF